MTLHHPHYPDPFEAAWGTDAELVAELTESIRRAQLLDAELGAAAALAEPIMEWTKA